FEREGQLKNVEIDMRRKDGTRIRTMLNAAPFHDSMGNVAGVLGSLRDITERTRLQAELLQSQRMEAVGRLAGGVAHDFNNLLTVIRASAGLALLELPEGHPLRPSLEEIDEAAQRSAELTTQLLAFARRQVVSPQVLDLNQLLRNIEKMLRRVIGEDVDLVTRLAAGACPVRANRSQLEQVVMNLAVNARDAMPSGGTLLLETANISVGGAGPGGVAPGEYVRLVVTDTGRGIPEEARIHIFEPFFTTKDIGKGTGLGLATCYGIVTQGGGHIEADSAPGRGSSFRVVLPRVSELPIASSRGERCRRSTGRETVLLVEDEAMVRRVTAAVLRERGYTVIEAAGAEEAIAFAVGSGGEAVDLLLSDVVLPKRSGPEVAERVRKARPRTRVLFMSGHCDDSRLGRALRQPGAAFLQKPFTPEALSDCVRRLLDEEGVIAADGG
ncbi:MAG: hybrid sensor histidine kinase/response regulator, partial [Candidatus Binatia bacterium]